MRSEHDGTDPQTLETVSDTLSGDVDDDTAGYSPADRPWVSNDWGTTDREEEAGEGLDGRLARELPEGAADDGDGLGDSSDTDDELYAEDEGVDGAGASAEEAAVHVVRE